MGQVESQPAGASLAPSVDPILRKEPAPVAVRPPRKAAGSLANDNDAASQFSSRSSFASRAARSPLQWAAAGAELIASTTADVAMTTMNAAFKTASVLASTTEAAANVVASTTTNVAINTASVATQTATLITTATSVGAKTAGDAIAGTASLVVEGFATTSAPGPSPKHLAARDARSRSRSGESSGQMSPQAKAQFFATTGGRATELMLPEAMALGAMKGSSSREDLSEMDQVRAPMRNVGTRFWCMVGATNSAARKHWVATVTSSKPSAPSAKYLRKILDLAWETKGQSVEEFYRLLQLRPVTSSPNCALKALITTLRIMREGPPEALSLSISHVGLIDTVGATWAERVLMDVSTDDVALSTQSQNAPNNTNPASDNSPELSAGNKKEVDDLLEQMLIARLSGLLVQKMHFHSKRTTLNARYETSKAEPRYEISSYPNAPFLQTPRKNNGTTAASGADQDTTRQILNKLSDDSMDSSSSYELDEAGDVWEREVQLSSSLLTLLGTIEGVVRLALGMGGNSPRSLPVPSTAALNLAAILIEEALSVFDALSAALIRTAGDPQRKDRDSNLVRSLLARYQDSYKSMRLYCEAARQFPYVAALNKVPLLDDELSPLSRGGFSSSRLLSSSSSSVSNNTSNQPASSTVVSPMHMLFAGSSSKSPAATTPDRADTGFSTNSRSAGSSKAPSLAARPFTRTSILEVLEEEEALEGRLTEKVSNGSESSQAIVISPLLKLMVPEGSTEEINNSSSTWPNIKQNVNGIASDATDDSDTEKEEDLPTGKPWGDFSSNSVEHARPPSYFCLGTESEDGRSDEQQQQLMGSEDQGAVTPVMCRTKGNPFDTGNLSVVLLAEAHRSAFSTISNPFASGSYVNPFATNQFGKLQSFATFQEQPKVPSPTLPKKFDDAAAMVNTRQRTQKQKQEALKRALEQCERLFEFSGINLRPEELEMTNEMIGRGAFSIVNKAKVLSTGQEVAVKELLIEEWGRSPETILDFRAEVAVMKAVHHPNVLQLIGASTTPNLRLISEFCHRGNLFDLLYNDRSNHVDRSRILSWSLRIRLALGEARGMHFLHTAFPAPLIHRDLKSLNLLLSKNWTLKVSDFGLSRFRRKGVTDGPCGTTQWMAPEVIQGKDYDERADVYSFGINLWEICTRRVPWEGRNDVKKAVVGGERPKLDMLTLDAGCPDRLVDLVQRCWAADPIERPDFGSIVHELKAIANEL